MATELCYKKPYSTFKHATFDAKEIRRKYEGEVTVPYRCRLCGSFHVGEPMTRAEGRKHPR